MQNFGPLLDAHVCADGCSRFTHAQTVLISPADVATAAAEYATLVEVRDSLVERGLVMLEGDPTPRLDAAAEPTMWAVRYESRVRAPSTPRRWFGRR